MPFSADILWRTPEGVEIRGRLYGDGRRMRSQHALETREPVIITDLRTGQVITLFPDRRGYTLFRAQPGIARADGGHGPCRDVANGQCRGLGEVQWHGRRATKWQTRRRLPQGEVHTTQWIDMERGLVLRHESSDGDQDELRMLGLEKRDGRTVEKWERVRSSGGRAALYSYHWYDPGLGMVVRDELPGGYVRTLTRIMIAPQDSSLFTVPVGYRRLDGVSGYQEGDPGVTLNGR
ncbi:MAG: hypothetical protein G8D28_07060 [gamma proteobacterium symbiont of Phacoides pectinatus]